MNPHDSTTPAGSKPPRSNTTRYLVSLGLLVLIVGGIAWVTQQLPGWRKPKQPTTIVADKKLLLFMRHVGQWGTKKDEELKRYPYKDFEPGTKGHYDLLFKNVHEKDVDVVFYFTSCDCSSVKAGGLPADEWERLSRDHTERPSEPLAYAREPDWVTLPVADPANPRVDPANKRSLRVKPGDGGVIRIEWVTRETGGKLNLAPLVFSRPVDDPNRSDQYQLAVPVKMTPALQFDPPRVGLGLLTTGRSARSEFFVWSSTRETLDFKLATTPPDPLFVFDTKPLSKKECEDLQEHLHKREIPANVRCAYRVTLTVHESRDGKYLDQGSFYRKWPVALDGKPVDPNAPLWGPEIVGRVEGDIQIGGADDQGRILFKSFDAKLGASREVPLATEAKVELEKFDGHPNQPSWLKVNLTRGEKQTSSGRQAWLLEVIVPPGAIGARSFAEPDAVVLRIAGTTDRFVRIPLDGHIGR